MKVWLSGFTLIELIIVLAIVAIIGAILIPNFLNTTDRARLRSDIQSTRVLQNAVDLHNIEQTPILMGPDHSEFVATLDNHGYVDIRRVAAQTAGARFFLNGNGEVLLDLSGVTTVSNLSDLVAGLSNQERSYILGSATIADIDD